MVPQGVFRPETELRARARADVSPRFPVIDMHAHFGALLLGGRYEEKYETARVVGNLRDAGLRRILSLELAWGGEYDRLRRKLEASDGFVAPVGSVDLSEAKRPGFAASVRRQVRELKAGGSVAVKLWKNMTLYPNESCGQRLRLDDGCFQPVWEACAEEGLPVIIHVADPPCFFKPIDERNEHYLCLKMHPEWSFYGIGAPGFEEHMRMQEEVIGRNPGTVFIVAHVGSYAENLRQVGAWLDAYPNMFVDVAARLDQLGRQPYTARAFLVRYQDRVLFGTDFEAGFDASRTREFYRTHYRFFQTRDEYFDHPFPDMLGQWKIYGVHLPDSVLRKLYCLNAQRLLKL